MARRKGAIRRVRDAAILIEDVQPPTGWHDTKWDPRQEVIRGEIERVAFELAGWRILLRIKGRWLPLDHVRLDEAIRVLDPEIGQQIEILPLGKEGRVYQYRVNVEDRTWPS